MILNTDGNVIVQEGTYMCTNRYSPIKSIDVGKADPGARDPGHQGKPTEVVSKATQFTLPPKQQC